MFQVRRSAWCWCWGLLLFASGAKAREPGGLVAASESFTLGEVLIVASGTDEKDTAATVVELDASDIEALGARTAADVLDHIPGGFVRVGDKGDAQIRLRGYRQREVKLLIDGVPVNDPWSGWQDLRFFPVSDLAEVRVIPAGGSVLYGPGNGGGVIELVTRKPTKERRLEASAEGGKGGYWRTTGFGGMSGGGYYSSLSLDVSDRQGFPLSGGFHSEPLENGNIRDNSDYRFAAGNFKVGYQDRDTHLGLSLIRRTAEYGAPVPLPPKTAKYERTEDLESTEVTIIGQRALTPRATMKLAGYTNGVDASRKFYDDDSYATQAGSKSGTEQTEDRISGANVSLRLDLGRPGRLSVACGYQHNGRDLRGFLMAKKGKRIDLDLAEDTWLRHLAIEEEIEVGERLTFVAGVRYDEWHGPGIEREPNWNVGVAWTPVASLAISPSFYRRTQFPLLRELYDTRSGNAALDPERVTGVNVDLKWQLPRAWRVRGAVFYDRLRNLIQKDDTTKIYGNISEAHYEGFEIGFGKELSPSLSLFSDYVFLRAKDDTGTVANADLQYRPRHRVDSRLTWCSGAGTRVSIMHTYTGRQFISTDDDATIRSANVFAVVARHRLNESFEIFARVQNLTDYNYYTSAGVPAPGRSLFGGVKAVF